MWLPIIFLLDRAGLEQEFMFHAGSPKGTAGNLASWKAWCVCGVCVRTRVCLVQVVAAVSHDEPDRSFANPAV